MSSDACQFRGLQRRQPSEDRSGVHREPPVPRLLSVRTTMHQHGLPDLASGNAYSSLLSLDCFPVGHDCVTLGEFQDEIGGGLLCFKLRKPGVVDADNVVGDLGARLCV